MSKKVVTTHNAPGAVGPYSQAIIANGLVFTAGQIAIVPGTSDIAAGGIQEQTAQVLRNVAAVLEAAGSSLDKVVKTTVFLKNVSDFAAMNETYVTFFPAERPARSTVQAELPRADALVEIEVIALA
ncbi:MAG: RidA family protein [Anaerolineae bacterium]|nr:RidA family protein [Anaerolineae bacterium]MBN8619504.1 RidA family protein [Anaerolineae bacterium]